jgi:predicted phage-related endonuclease
MRLGHQRESVIADVVSRHLGARMRETGSWPHPEHSFLFASPDRLMIDRNGDFGLLECKSVGRLAKLSDKFLLQVQTQLACVPAAKYAYIAEYDGTTCILHRVTRDSDLIKGILPYLVDVYTAALPALEGRESADNVFSEDVKPFGRMEQNEIRRLLEETRRDHVSETVVVKTK